MEGNSTILNTARRKDTSIPEQTGKVAAIEDCWVGDSVGGLQVWLDPDPTAAAQGFHQELLGTDLLGSYCYCY